MKRILVVDDDKGALKLIDIMLNRSGFDVVNAESANQALDVLDRETPDLIILDIMMPVVNGIDLCAMIRQRSPTTQTPILILSAKSDSSSVIDSLEAGANDYLIKPIFHHDLASKIRGMLGMVTDTA